MNGPGARRARLAAVLPAGCALLAGVAAAGAAGPVVGAPRQEQGQTLARQEGQQERPAGSILLDQLPELPLTVTPEEEEALRLVDQILREQNVLAGGKNFVYRAEGRRDPFRSLLRQRQRELAAPETRPPGLAGFLISEVQVSAVARYQGRWHVLLIGLDRRSYVAQVGTELYDGRIIEINDREVVFEQEVEDLLGTRTTRRVVKPLRGEDD